MAPHRDCKSSQPSMTPAESTQAGCAWRCALGLPMVTHEQHPRSRAAPPKGCAAVPDRRAGDALPVAQGGGRYLFGRNAKTPRPVRVATPSSARRAFTPLLSRE